jgi:inhibitor of cysteine peptidase
MTEHRIEQLAVVALLAGVALGIALAVGALSVVDSGDSRPDTSEEPPGEQSPVGPADQLAAPAGSAAEVTIEQFGSTEAFREYVRAGEQRVGTAWRGLGQFQFFEGDVETSTAAPDGAQDTASGGPDRIANSNVQVAGLDEPDIVKTDGRNFYYSPSAGRHVLPPPRVGGPGGGPEDVALPPEADSQSHVLDTSNPADPAAMASVQAGGELLQTGDRLVVFNQTGGAVVGYNVSDPANPVESWRLPLEDRLVTARETGGQLYVVTQTVVGPAVDCPITPLGDHTVDCGDVYAPDSQTGAGATYTAFSIDAGAGTIEDSVSVMGTGDDSVVYMSPDGLYLTDTTGVTGSELRLSWAEHSEIVPDGLAERIAEIDSYDISEWSKRQEMRRAVQNWSGAVEGTGRTLQDDLDDYRVQHQENLTRTTIVRIDVDGERLRVGESGTVPGEPLNQFALDEYQGTLRITTTIPRVAGAESDNHLYVLDNETLAEEARVTGMGHDQRVYSVRYVGDTAYVVTFRQVDPFYVIDFEEPTEPELLSELELPGFSSYLHPADDGHVIGIGEESGQVKSVLFDVTDPTDTAVADDLVLGEHWSAIEESHHAFMIDRRHEVFVLPAGNTARVVDYAGGNLEVVTEVTAEEEVTRARYVDDYLYVFAGGEVIVLDQTNWEQTTTLSVGDG